ncbi:MAG: SagB/ThcOx family dehydrogenase [Candidatus Nanoarchaeia archaeon]
MICINFNKISFTKTLIHRRSRRKFSFRKLSINELSALLYFTAGIKEDGSRFYPSGGGRYPLELYLISLETELKKGLYHYYPPNHVLEKLIEIKELNFENIFTPYNQTWVKNAAIIFLVTAIFNRSAIKYGERAYRLILIEAGHIGQNFYLVSEALGLNCCAIAGINDVYIEKMLDIDGVKESLIYACALG